MNKARKVMAAAAILAMFTSAAASAELALDGSVVSGGAQAVRQSIRRIGEELRDTMAMCGARTLDAITADMVNLPR